MLQTRTQTQTNTILPSKVSEPRALVDVSDLLEVEATTDEEESLPRCVEEEAPHGMGTL